MMHYTTNKGIFLPRDESYSVLNTQQNWITIYNHPLIEWNSGSIDKMTYKLSKPNNNIRNWRDDTNNPRPSLRNMKRKQQVQKTLKEFLVKEERTKEKSKHRSKLNKKSRVQGKTKSFLRFFLLATSQRYDAACIFSTHSFNTLMLFVCLTRHACLSHSTLLFFYFHHLFQGYSIPKNLRQGNNKKNHPPREFIQQSFIRNKNPNNWNSYLIIIPRLNVVRGRMWK